VDDRLEQALALLIGSLSSVVLLWGNYRWGGRRRKDEIEDEHEHHHEED
jgi:hypothetical protein